MMFNGSELHVMLFTLVTAMTLLLFSQHGRNNSLLMEALEMIRFTVDRPKIGLMVAPELTPWRVLALMTPTPLMILVMW